MARGGGCVEPVEKLFLRLAVNCPATAGTATVRQFAPLVPHKMRRVRLYDARSSCLTYLANNDVPDHILARRAGHTNVKTTKKWYVKPDVEDLRGAATASDGLHGVATPSREKS